MTQALANKNYKVVAPLGYSIFGAENPMDATAVRAIAYNLVDSEVWRKSAENAPFEEVLDCLVKNGYAVEVHRCYK